MPMRPSEWKSCTLSAFYSMTVELEFWCGSNNSRICERGSSWPRFRPCKRINRFLGRTSGATKKPKGASFQAMESYVLTWFIVFAFDSSDMVIVQCTHSRTLELKSYFCYCYCYLYHFFFFGLYVQTADTILAQHTTKKEPKLSAKERPNQRGNEPTDRGGSRDGFGGSSWWGSVLPAEEHDDAALDDVEPRPLLLDGPPEASSPLPPLAPHKLHPRFSSLLILLCVLCVCVCLLCWWAMVSWVWLPPMVEWDTIYRGSGWWTGGRRGRACSETVDSACLRGPHRTGAQHCRRSRWCGLVVRGSQRAVHACVRAAAGRGGRGSLRHGKCVGDSGGPRRRRARCGGGGGGGPRGGGGGEGSLPRPLVRSAAACMHGRVRPRRCRGQARATCICTAAGAVGWRLMMMIGWLGQDRDGLSPPSVHAWLLLLGVNLGAKCAGYRPVY